MEIKTINDFNRCLSKRINPNAATLLSTLLTQAFTTNNGATTSEIEWGAITDHQISSKIQLSPRMQKRSFEHLKKQGLIRHRTNGSEHNHVFKINFTALHSMIGASITIEPQKNSYTTHRNKSQHANAQCDFRKLCSLIFSKEKIHSPKEGLCDQSNSVVLMRRTIPPVSRDVFVEYWNKKPSVPRHPNPNTTAYKNCIRIFKDLMSGKFITKRPRLKAFIKAQGLSQDLLTKAWTEEELYNMLDRLATLCTKSTKIKTRSLIHLLFSPLHPTKMYSLFLIAADDRRFKKLTGGEVLADSSPHLTEKALEAGFRKSTEVLIKIINHISTLKEFYRSLPPRVFKDRHDDSFVPHITHVCPSEERFVLHYLKYLKKKDWSFQPEPGILSPRSKTFRTYLEECWDRDTNATRKGLISFL